MFTRMDYRDLDLGVSRVDSDCFAKLTLEKRIPGKTSNKKSKEKFHDLIMFLRWSQPSMWLMLFDGTRNGKKTNINNNFNYRRPL